MNMLRYFIWPFIVTAIGLALGLWLGWASTGTFAGTLSIFFIVCVLVVLEISLSFDNAIVNANKLKQMSPIWQRRFLTWGIVIAVFGMRIIFPIAVVAIAAHIKPIAALRLALAEPATYAAIMDEARIGIAAFGGTFLMMVALGFFFDQEKEIHWVVALEARISGVASLRGVEMVTILVLILVFGSLIETAERLTFITAAVWGLVTFQTVDVLGSVLDRRNSAVAVTAQGGLGAFLYLEVLDASFSFDGVIGAFALTQNLLVIAIGLGIGAMYVRSMTIMLVQKGTLTQFRYLEHGAFYAILILSIIMYAQSLVHVPEVLTGLVGAVTIGLALWSSIRFNRVVGDA